MAGVTGLEPAASGVTGQRSNQLSYTPDPMSPEFPVYMEKYRLRARMACVKPNGRAPYTRIEEGKWWAVTGSNRRPSRCKRDALPAELTAP